MSAAVSMARATAESRRFPRHPINVALDVIALRSGVPENLPGRCTDLSEGGVGGMVAGELASGQQVAVELRLPNVGVPLRARALVRYQGRLRCGFEFVALPAEQREMIRYWAHRVSLQARPGPSGKKPQAEGRPAEVRQLAPVRVSAAAVPLAVARRRIRIQPRQLYLLAAVALLLVAAVWWKWQLSWNELETGAQAAPSAPSAPMRVSPETMNMRIVSKVDPVYPEDARRAGKEGLVVLDAVIAADGTVERVRPISGDDLLAKAATEAVRNWKFEPYQSSGRRVEVETSIAVEFRLN